jgi:hypothetical protein
MKIVERSDIDIKKWDNLVDQSDALVFSRSAYLDAVAETWCILVDENYTKGIALPYSLRLKQRKLYTPIFSRYTEWIGDANGVDLLDECRKLFPIGQCAIRSEGELVYQEWDDQVKIGSQATRMIKKAQKANFEFIESEYVEEIIELINSELPKKVSSLKKNSLTSLAELIKNLKAEGFLKIKAVVDNKGHFRGGLFFIEYKDRVIYLKGAFDEEAKKNGAMYWAMSDEIENTASKGKIFDFGGSRVQGVKRFNQNLGGKDMSYSMLSWDDSPGWYKVASKLAKKIKP